MASSISHPNQASPLDRDVWAPDIERKDEVVLKATFGKHSRVAKPQEIQIEIEYSEKRFDIEPGVVLEALEPLKLAYRTEGDLLEVVGWGLTVTLGEGASLSWHVGRRFLELFSRAQQMLLSNEEAAIFAEICAQVDYKAFCAARRVPQWRQAWLVRLQPVCLIHYGTGRNIKLGPNAACALSLVQPGEYFGGWFSCDKEGTIESIRGVQILAEPTVPENNEWPSPASVEFDSELKMMLPDPTKWASEE